MKTTKYIITLLLIALCFGCDTKPVTDWHKVIDDIEKPCIVYYNYGDVIKSFTVTGNGYLVLPPNETITNVERKEQ